MMRALFLNLVLLLASNTLAFVSPTAPRRSAQTCVYAEGDNQEKGGFFSGVKNFFEELDAFVDDASARRLGAGASFYGKRKSNFYGDSDKMKKADKNKYDPTGESGLFGVHGFLWRPNQICFSIRGLQSNSCR